MNDEIATVGFFFFFCLGTIHTIRGLTITHSLWQAGFGLLNVWAMIYLWRNADIPLTKEMEQKSNTEADKQ